MPTFGFDKPIDDIESAVLLPEEWYQFEIMEDPGIFPNKKLSDELPEDPSQEDINAKIGEVEGGGLNLILRMETISSDDAYNGRKMTLWLPWPSAKDHEIYNARGQKNYDAKMERVVAFAEAFGGAAQGENITLQSGLKGMCYVVQRTNNNTGEIENSIDMFQGFAACE